MRYEMNKLAGGLDNIKDEKVNIYLPWNLYYLLSEELGVTFDSYIKHKYGVVDKVICSNCIKQDDIMITKADFSYNYIPYQITEKKSIIDKIATRDSILKNMQTKSVLFKDK